MSIPYIIHKQFKEEKYRPVDKMRDNEWFAFVENYGAEYGNLSKKYRFKKQPKLLNIGNANVRTMIEDKVMETNPKLIEYCNPNEQYSGISGNQKYHNILKANFGDEYDGTIMDEHNLVGNQIYSKEELDGPSEIVIWKDYDELLEELPSNNGGATCKKKLSKRRSKKKQTNKRQTKSKKKRTNKK